MSSNRFARDFHEDFDMESPEFNARYEDVIEDLLESCPLREAGPRAVTG